MRWKKIILKKWDKFNRLTIINDIPKRTWSELKRECKCDCWNIKWVWWSRLVNWWIKSCWCLSADKARENVENLLTKHWLYKDIVSDKERKRFCTIYYKMRDRCYNTENKEYQCYWWRWIKLLWNSFEDFYNDMYESYCAHCDKCWLEQTTIERIDVNKNYCKENCKWATYKEQWYNKRNTIYTIIDWNRYTTKEITEMCWIKQKAASKRIRLYNKWLVSKEYLFTKWRIRQNFTS